MARYDVVITPSFAQAERWRKCAADAGAEGVFAQVVGTFDAWIADLWELHGDGRALVNSVVRHVFMRAALQEGPAELDLPGTAFLAAGCMRKAAGLRELEDAIAQACAGQLEDQAASTNCGADALSAREIALLQVLGRYSEMLREAGLVEPGHAAAELAQRNAEVFPRPLQVLFCQAAPLTWIQRQFFDACPQLDLTVELAEGAQGVGQAPEGVEVHFAFPSGRLAQPGLVGDLVLQRAAEADAGEIVVACKDPLFMYDQLESRLAEHGLDVRVQTRKAFGQTDFGRTFLAMCRVLHSEPWDQAALSDVLYSPFSGFSRSDAHGIDASLRADRLVTRQAAFDKLRALSEPFGQLEEIALDPEADVLVGAFEQMVQASAYRTPAWRAEQLAAMGGLRDVTSAARWACVGIDTCAEVLQHATLPISVQAASDAGEPGAGARPVVTFTTQALAARMGEKSCQAIVITDLTSDDFPVADKDDAASTLLGKLGLQPWENALSRARRDFSALLRLPTNSIDIVRPLGDANADATYPCAVLEEFVDAYRADPTATDDIDNPYRVPPSLSPAPLLRGEELLFANARAQDAQTEQPAAAVVPQPLLQESDKQAEGLFMRARHTAEGEALQKPCPSPSQIETYLECPYRWFASRRLRIETLDEEFSALERGTFAHAAMEAFYRRFQAMGHLKVNADNLEEARTVMREVLDQLVQEQPQMEPSSGRLVAKTELERREMAILCDQMVAFLDFEAKLLPTFHPAYLEYEIDAEHAVDYAGYSLVGKVDRIDVDDFGHAVIVDYKGSVNAEHEIAGTTLAHAGKVQTRIYAQAVKRALGLDVVGALYVSYGRRPKVAGAYDPRVLEAAHLPTIRTDKCACGTIQEPLEKSQSGTAVNWLLSDLSAEAGASVPSMDADAQEPAEGAAAGPRSFAELAFPQMLDATEQLVSTAVAAMCAGDVEPRPSYAHACTYCPVICCSKRGA